MYGSPAETSQAQYPIGTRTWFKLKIKYGKRASANIAKKKSSEPMVLCLSRTYPAAAMSAKSVSFIQESQWVVRISVAIVRSWYCPNVHSSTILESPVSSNMLGVIHGYTRQKQGASSIPCTWRGTPKKCTSSTSHPPRLTPRTFCAPYGKLGLNPRATGTRPARARRTVDAADENISRNGYGPWNAKGKKSPKKTRPATDAILLYPALTRGREGLEGAKIARRLELQRS